MTPEFTAQATGLAWNPGPCKTGNDEIPPNLWVGDHYLVLIAVKDLHDQRVYWQPHIIVPTDG